MKLCCLFLAVAFTAALTTSVDCVPHARHARAVALAVVKPKAAAPKAAAPKAAAPKAAGPSVAKILPELVKSLSGNRSPTTKNTGLNKLADVIVKANIVQTDSKGKLTQKAVSNLATETVNALVAASNTSKANGKKMLDLVKNGLKPCTNIDCVMKQVGVGAKFLSPSAPKVLQELLTAATEVAGPASSAFGGFGGGFAGFGGGDVVKSIGSMFNNLGGPDGSKGISSMFNGLGAAGASFMGAAPGATPGAAPAAGNAMNFDSLLKGLGAPGNGNLDFASMIGNAGPKSVNPASASTGFGAGAVQGSGFPGAPQGVDFSSLIGGIKGAVPSQGAAGASQGGPINFSAMLGNFMSPPKSAALAG